MESLQVNKGSSQLPQGSTSSVESTRGNKFLSAKQIAAIEALVNREDKESMEDVAKNAGVDRTTLYNYLKEPIFRRAYIDRINQVLYSHRGSITKRLIEAASNPLNKSQIPAMTLYYRLQNALVDQLQVEVNDVSRPVQLNTLPLAVKKLLIYCLNGGVLDKSIEEVVSSYCDRNMHRVGNSEGREEKVIEVEGRVVDSEEDNQEEVIEDGVFTICQI